MKRLAGLVLWLGLLGMIFPAANASTQREQIVEEPELVRPLMNGEFVPDVVLKTESGGDIRLRDIVETKPSVIIFYRGGWCPYCNRQMAGLVEVEQRIQDLGYQIIAISPDSPARLKTLQGSDDFELIKLSDIRLEATRAFGLGYYVAEDQVQRYRGKLGAELTSLAGESRVVLPVPAVYLVDDTGLVHFQYVNPNYKVRVSPQLLYQAARIIRQGR